MTNSASSGIADRVAAIINSQDVTVDATCAIAEALNVPVEDILIGGAK